MKIGLKGAIGIGLSIALLAFALRDVHFAEVWRELRGSNLLYFAASTIAGTLIFPLRARRWRTILEPVAPNLPMGMLWRATAIGMMVNNVVPARAGELARSFALARETPRVSFSAGIASIAVDRLFDAIVVLLLMTLAMLDPAFTRALRGGSATLVTGAAITGTVGVLAVMLVLYAIVFFPARLINLFGLFARRVAPRFEERGKRMLRAFADGLGVLRHPGRFIAVFSWTLAHWVLNAFAFWLAFQAVGIDVPVSAAFVLQGLISIGVALPAAPGFFGVFEALGRAGLGLYGVPGNLAVTWAIGYHILTFIPITLFGAYYFTRLGLSMGELSRVQQGNGATTDGDGDSGARAPLPPAARR